MQKQPLNSILFDLFTENLDIALEDAIRHKQYQNAAKNLITHFYYFAALYLPTFDFSNIYILSQKSLKLRKLLDAINFKPEWSKKDLEKIKYNDSLIESLAYDLEKICSENN